MKSLEVEQLLDRYLKGETSLAEERQLREAFLSEELPSHLRAYKPYFTYLKQQKQGVCPPINLADILEEKPVARTLQIRRAYKVFAYAAGFIILMASTFLLLNRERVNSQLYKPMTPKEIVVAQKYLSFLAQNIEYSAAVSSHSFQKLELLNAGNKKLLLFENTYNTQVSRLKKIQEMDKSMARLKYLKAFETLN
jgi:hypothetical protein